MTITLPDIEFLTSEAGSHVLTRLASEDLSESTTLRLLTVLRKDYSAEQARAALEMARLRVKAIDKFGTDANVMLFTRDALEQASDPVIRRYRASQIGTTRVVDACCGIGADSLALAAAGADVIGVDLDEVRIEIARFNASALGSNRAFSKSVMCGWICLMLISCSSIPADAMSRAGVFITLNTMDRHFQQSTHGLNEQIIVKLSPGVDLSQLESYEWSCRIYFREWRP